MKPQSVSKNKPQSHTLRPCPREQLLIIRWVLAMSVLTNGTYRSITNGSIKASIVKCKWNLHCLRWKRICAVSYYSHSHLGPRRRMCIPGVSMRSDLFFYSTGYPCIPTTSTLTTSICPSSCHQSTSTYTTTTHKFSVYYPPCPTSVNVYKKRTWVACHITFPVYLMNRLPR